MNERVKNQIELVWKSRKVNMLSHKSVQMYAFSKGYYQLVSFIAENENAYLRYIFAENLLT